MARYGGPPEWLSSNANRAFPFDDDSDFSTVDGGSLPLGLLLDFRAVVVSGRNAGSALSVKLTRASVARTGDGKLGVTLFFSVPQNSGLPSPNAITSGIHAKIEDGGTTEVHARSVAGPDSYMHGFVPDIVDVYAVVGAPYGSEGQYEMAQPPDILPTRVLHIPCGVGLDTVTVDGLHLQGDIHVLDGLNTTLSISEGKMSLDVGYGIGKGYACPPELEDRCEFVMFLNGQAPSSDGNIDIVGGEGITVSSGEYKGMPAVEVSLDPSVSEFARPRSRSRGEE